MSWIVVVVGIFYLNGEFDVFADKIPADQPCGFEQALELAVTRATGEFNREFVLWRCDAIPAPPPTPSIVPGKQA